MRIVVKLFAMLRERTGQSEIVLDLPVDSTVSAAVRQVAQEFPAIAPMLSRVAYAVNQTYVPSDTKLHDGDELAIIPPVSGG